MFVIMCIAHAQAECSGMSILKDWLELGLRHPLRLSIERFGLLFWENELWEGDQERHSKQGSLLCFVLNQSQIL